MSENDDTAAVLEKLGGDARVLALFELAMTGYSYLPPSLLNWKTGKATRDKIIETIESFGFRAAPIPWERFPKRFHKNRPELQLFKPELTDADIEKCFTNMIAANQTPAKPRRKGKAA